MTVCIGVIDKENNCCYVGAGEFSNSDDHQYINNI